MDRCPLCPGIHNCVAGDGPCNDYIFLGEAPGWEEDKKGIPFVGKVGQEFNSGYLPAAGLRRPNVRVLNAIRCLPPGAKGKLDPKKQKDLDLLQSCAETFLYPELEKLRPKLIIPMGVFACRAIDPSIDLELEHGRPHDTPYGMAFPMYHPAGGIHEPKKMLQIRTDWVRLRKYIGGKLWIPYDEYQGQEYYAQIEDPDDVDAVLYGNWDSPMAADTETTYRHQPFCLTFSVQPGTGFLILADNKPALERVQQHLDRWDAPILFHNWLFDIHVTQDMGLQFPHRLIKDTMALTFHLGNLPQGLKTLAYRELGMVMQDFDDLVIPHSRKVVLEYYRRAYDVDWGKPEPEIVRDKEGNWKLYSPQGFHTKLKRFFTDYEKDPERDVSKAWEENWVDMQETVQAVLGPWTGKCISHAWDADRAATIRYACRDADATLRLYPVLRRMKSQVRHTVQENWGDGDGHI